MIRIMKPRVEELISEIKQISAQYVHLIVRHALRGRLEFQFTFGLE